MVFAVNVSEACQINDLDHSCNTISKTLHVSEACQINDLDHLKTDYLPVPVVSEACQINDLDHQRPPVVDHGKSFRSLSDQ